MKTYGEKYCLDTSYWTCMTKGLWRYNDFSFFEISNHCADQKTTQPPKHFYKYQDIEFRQLDLPDFNKIHNIKIQIGCTLEIKSQIIWIC